MWGSEETLTRTVATRKNPPTTSDIHSQCKWDSCLLLSPTMTACLCDNSRRQGAALWLDPAVDDDDDEPLSPMFTCHLTEVTWPRTATVFCMVHRNDGCLWRREYCNVYMHCSVLPVLVFGVSQVLFWADFVFASLTRQWTIQWFICCLVCLGNLFCNRARWPWPTPGGVPWLGIT